MRLRLLHAVLWRDRLRDAGEQARREHSAFLTQAICTRLGVRSPRIPTRRVDEGGFDRLMADPRGRRAAGRFWSAALVDNE